MPKITNFTTKAPQTRERVRKHRKFNKIKEIHEENVRDMNLKEQSNVDNSEQTNIHENKSDFDIEEELKYWAVKHKITKRAINDLLAILVLAGFTCFPKDSRTLMKTPTNVDIRPLSSGKLWYNGIGNTLTRVLGNCNHDMTIHLNFNFDGLPLFDSSVLQFWPILCSIHGDYYTLSLCTKMT